MSDVTKISEELNQAIADFKDLGERLSELEAKGESTAEIEASVDKANEEITRLSGELQEAQADAQKRIDDLELQLNREGLYSKEKNEVAESAARFYSHLRGEHIDPSQVDVDEYIKYRDAYRQYLRHDRDALPQGVMEVVKNTAREGSDPDGGFFVPDEMESGIVRRLFRTSPMRQIARVRTIGREAYTWLVRDSQAASGGWIGEQGTSSETAAPTYRKGRAPVHKQFAEPRITEEVLEDAMIDIESEVEEAVAEIMSQTENTAFVNGSGSDRPKGFLQYTTSTSNEDDSPPLSWNQLQYVATGTSAGFGKYSETQAAEIASLIDVQTELHPRYRSNAVWVMNRGTFATCRKLRDADGNLLWERNLEDGPAMRLLGAPVFEFEDMPDIAANSFSIAYGDFRSGYVIVNRRGIRVLRDPYTTKGVVKYYTTARVGGAVQNSDAIKLIKFGTS